MKFCHKRYNNIDKNRTHAHLIESPPPSPGFLAEAGCVEAEVAAVAADFPFLPLKLDQIVRQTEKADRAVKANQSRRAPNPGGAVHKNLNLLRRPRKTNPVHLGRQDQPMTRPIMTASHIGTAQSRMSTNVSVIEGFFQNSIRSKKVSSISVKNFSNFPGKLYDFPGKLDLINPLIQESIALHGLWIEDFL